MTSSYFTPSCFYDGFDERRANAEMNWTNLGNLEIKQCLHERFADHGGGVCDVRALGDMIGSVVHDGDLETERETERETESEWEWERERERGGGRGGDGV